MLIHICDCCKKEMKDNEIIKCSIPVEEEMNATSNGHILMTYKTGKIYSKDIELCPICATTLADMFQIMKQ